MTPKEKAEELFNKMAFEICNTDAKKCALISVDEVLFTLNEVSEEDESTYAYNTALFYNKVKTELKKI